MAWSYVVDGSHHLLEGPMPSFRSGPANAGIELLGNRGMDIVGTSVVTPRGHNSPCVAVNDGNGILKTADRRHVSGQLNKSTYRLDLRSMDPLGSPHSAQLCRRGPWNLLLVLGSEVLKDAVDVGQDEERISLKRLGHDRCGEVLVDDGLNALELAFFAADDGNSTSTGADDDGSGLQERAHQSGLDDPLRLGGGRRRDGSARHRA